MFRCQPPLYLSASTLAANLLGYSRENGVWAKARSKAKCQVPDGCWGKPRYQVTRTYGPFGQFKIDWIFVRSTALKDPYDTRQPYRFSPNFGRTLRELNHSLSGPISDHNPITADLPVGRMPQSAGAPEDT